jgi:hypothetical protein
LFLQDNAAPQKVAITHKKSYRSLQAAQWRFPFTLRVAYSLGCHFISSMTPFSSRLVVLRWLCWAYFLSPFVVCWSRCTCSTHLYLSVWFGRQ